MIEMGKLHNSVPGREKYILKTHLNSPPGLQLLDPRAKYWQRIGPVQQKSSFQLGNAMFIASPAFFFAFFLCIFFSGTKHPKEDNPNLYYWAEITGLHTQTFNI